MVERQKTDLSTLVHDDVVERLNGCSVGHLHWFGLVRFNVPLDTIGHFGDESSQAINYTGTDNEKGNELNKACTHKPKKITQKHALSNNEKKTKATTTPWFSRLLRHPARKRSGSIL